MIYLLEDDASIRDFVIYTLNSQEMPAQGFAAPSEFWRAMEEQLPRLVLLDIMLPELSGLELLRRLRRTSAVPVILLTARGAVTDKVSGLDMGANDYITKPFAIEELLARIRVLLRPRTEDAAQDNHILRGCGIEMNTLSHAVTYKGAPVEFTNREFVLLKTLLENKNIAMTREQLLETAWGYDYMGETNVVDVYVRYIRQKTADAVITTIRGVGYMMKTE